MSFPPLFHNFNIEPGLTSTDAPGLTQLSRKEWPAVSGSEGTDPIDILKPKSEVHKRVLNYLLGRIFDAEKEMSNFYGRWRAIEKRNQAWIDLPDWERKLKEANDSGKPPKAVDIVVPFSFATLQTISTYMMQVFMGRRPHFPVGTYSTGVQNAMKMEVVLQYQADHMRFARLFWQWLNDANAYGMGALWTRWKIKVEPRTVSVQRPVLDLMSGALNQESFREQQDRVVYEGNEVEVIDPFMFFPDPRVSMLEVAEKGEYVFRRFFEGKHSLKRAESQGLLKWVDSANPTIPQGTGAFSSARDFLSRGISHPGAGLEGMGVSSRSYYKVDQGSVEIIPRELGIGASEKVEKWIFTILNDSQIVQAERQINDHNRHPVVVIEPLTTGHAFGAPSMSDYIAPLQDSMSWFLNSHMDNVRRAVNDMFVYDPAAVEEQDLKKPRPGMRLRLKPTAIGRDIKTVFQQIPIQDVTRGHVSDMQTYMEIAQRISAVTDNLLGLQDPGGRKTATEVRVSSESAASRLAAMARLVSAQGVSFLTYQMSLNTQQFLTQEFYVRVVGPDGLIHPLVIDPEGLTGDFYYPLHDGSLPLDRVALLDVWRELFVAILQDPQLRQTYSIPKIFEFMAELGGAKNVKNFRLAPATDSQIDQQAQLGNLAPVPGGQGPAGLTNSFTPNPGNRLAQGSPLQ